MLMPSWRNAPTARGVSPSPHALSRPYAARSNTATSAPRRAAAMAAAAPAGPAPITAMSQVGTAVNGTAPSDLPAGAGNLWAVNHNPHLDPAIYEYLLAHNPPPDDLTAELVAETEAMGDIARMQAGLDQAAFLGFMVGLLQARLVVEIGTFTGLSSLAMARALPPGGRIVCLDVSEEYTAVARRFWERAGVADRITLRIGPAAASLASLDDWEEVSVRGGAADRPIDLAFIDADKSGYPDYYRTLADRLSPNGVIIADNIFMNGEVVKAEPGPDAAAMTEFARSLQNDPLTETVLVPLGDGLSLTRLAPSPI